MIRCKCKNCGSKYRTQDILSPECPTCYSSRFDTIALEDVSSSAAEAARHLADMKEQTKALGEAIAKATKPTFIQMAKDLGIDTEDMPLFIPDNDTSLIDWMEKKK
jgi:predicted  nucleic acid-binding Zn-ribbon protein